MSHEPECPIEYRQCECCVKVECQCDILQAAYKRGKRDGEQA